MLSKSDTSVADTLTEFNRWELDVSLLVPTETAIGKSIMDATASVREFLLGAEVHDFRAQAQGPDHKVVEKAYFVHPDRLEETTVSFYRPVTKSGDPRIWFARLKGYAAPNNLLALVVRDGTVYVVNCSRREILAGLSDPATPVGQLARKAGLQEDPAVGELLEKLRAISTRGFVPTLRPGDTGIGMTLETMLGIAANTARTPDFKGIEIKAKRLRKSRPNRATLFSQVPNWKLSPIGSAWNLLSKYGYERGTDLRLYHEINSVAPNSIGFVLKVDKEQDWLKQNHVDPETQSSSHLVTWEMEKLRQRLLEKHAQTFWVGAQCRGRGDGEEFHYVHVEHTRSPSVKNFEALLEAGLVSVDYLMKRKQEGVVRDHGYLFKIHPRDLGALFPPSSFHALEG